MLGAAKLDFGARKHLFLARIEDFRRLRRWRRIGVWHGGSPWSPNVLRKDVFRGVSPPDSPSFSTFTPIWSGRLGAALSALHLGSASDYYDLIGRYFRVGFRFKY
jgi:hypothetical protein